jgi:hypothetical protein
MVEYITPDIVIDKCVALVGSSANLIDKSYGKEIDSFDEIIRFNRAPTEGYESDVGSRTTIRCSNGHVFKGIPPDNRFNIKTQNPNFIKNESNSKIIVVEYEKGYGDGKKYIHETSEVFFMENLNFLAKKYGLNKSPTIGFRMVYILLKNNYTPTLYGFGLNESPQPTHYWETLRHKSIHHNINKERIILRKWMEEKKIIVKL